MQILFKNIIDLFSQEFVAIFHLVDFLTTTVTLLLIATVVWLTQISSPRPFRRSQGRRPHCYCCVADSDLASAFPTFSRLPSSLLLLCGWLRSRRLGLSDVLKAAILIATVVWLTQISPQPFWRSQGRRPYCYCCVADSDLGLSDVLKAIVLIATVVWLTQISAFPTFSRPPSSLPLLCGWLRSRPFRRSQGHRPHCHSFGQLRSRSLGLSGVLKATVFIATIMWLTRKTLLTGIPRLGNFFFLTKNSLKKLIKQ